jgi:ABC-type branched-subunit amino acid transport system permease subunit
MGIVFIVTILWAPNGIMGLAARLRRKPVQSP